MIYVFILDQNRFIYLCMLTHPQHAMPSAKKLVSFVSTVSDKYKRLSTNNLRSNRLMSMTLLQYVTEVDGDNDDETEGEIQQVTFMTEQTPAPPPAGVPVVDSAAVKQEVEVKKACSAAYGLAFDTKLSCAQKDQFLKDLVVTFHAANALVEEKGRQCAGMSLVVTAGMALIDDDTGETFSKGKLINVDSFTFQQHSSPCTLRAGEQGCCIATLPIKCYAAWNSSLRLNYLRTKFDILSTLSERALNKMQCEHKWLECAASTILTGHIALITHGVVRTLHEEAEGASGGGGGAVRTSAPLFPGSVAGVSEYISKQQWCEAVASTCAGVAVISTDTFQRFRKQEDFIKALMESTFERSVLSEHSNSATTTTGGDAGSGGPTPPVIIHTHSSVKLTSTLDKQIMAADGTLRLNQYTVLNKIGSGATASVIKCTEKIDEQEHHRVLKIIKRGVSDRSIKREVDALQALQHQNIVRLLEVIDCHLSSVVVLVQEFASWGSLLGVVLTMNETKNVAIGCVRALRHIHDEGFIHGDIKNANIFRNSHGQVKVGDFGCATRVDDDKSSVKPRGTPAFMSPEVFTGAIGPATDVWALHITLYALVYGTVPFKATTTTSLQEAICYSEVAYPSNRSNSSRTEDDLSFRQLLEGGLNKQSQLRSTLHQVEEHPWLRSRRRGSFTT